MQMTMNLSGGSGISVQPPATGQIETTEGMVATATANSTDASVSCVGYRSG